MDTSNKNKTSRELVVYIVLAAVIAAIIAVGATVGVLSKRSAESVTASPAPEEEAPVAEQMQEETQVVETVLLSTYQVEDETEVLPTDDIQPSNVLPTDDLPTDDVEEDDVVEEVVSEEATSAVTVETPPGSTELPYEEEAVEEVVEAKTYNGIIEGDIYTGTLSYYDVCYQCCGSLTGVTASGKVIYNGMENPYVCSCNWLPLGTTVSINGVEYTVADRGGTGLSTIGRIDIFVPEGHQAALNLGITYGAEIIILAFPEGV